MLELKENKIRVKKETCIIRKWVESISNCGTISGDQFVLAYCTQYWYLHKILTFAQNIDICTKYWHIAQNIDTLPKPGVTLSRAHSSIWTFKDTLHPWIVVVLFLICSLFWMKFCVFFFKLLFPKNKEEESCCAVTNQPSSLYEIISINCIEANGCDDYVTMTCSLSYGPISRPSLSCLKFS